MLGVGPDGPPKPKRSGSLSSGSQLALAGAENTSPSSNENFTSPESQGQSEQLSFFKDYYSSDEVKAFPLVCICLPQHWRKTIEGDSTEGSGHPQGYQELP